METEDLEHRKETRDESSTVLWEALTRAQKAYEEAKKHADIVHLSVFYKISRPQISLFHFRIVLRRGSSLLHEFPRMK